MSAPEDGPAGDRRADPRMREVYAWVALDRHGVERVMAAKIGPRVAVNMMAASRDQAERMREAADQVGAALGVLPILARFLRAPDDPPEPAGGGH